MRIQFFFRRLICTQYRFTIFELIPKLRPLSLSEYWNHFRERAWERSIVSMQKSRVLLIRTMRIRNSVRSTRWFAGKKNHRASELRSKNNATHFPPTCLSANFYDVENGCSVGENGVQSAVLSFILWEQFHTLLLREWYLRVVISRRGALCYEIRTWMGKKIMDNNRDRKHNALHCDR